ncbi:MAG: SPOR domain-containing protein, partial [Candidatus Omnitrophica bacterium]|nr:SPOR domain-containing protein [Candidatus Omnitrophota bacterium]
GISIESVKNSVKSVLLEARKKKVDSTYTVQVASFRKKVYAEKEAMDLKKKGYEIFVVPKGDYSIVCVGKFAYKNEANQMSRKLRKRYKDCLVRSL